MALTTLKSRLGALPLLLAGPLLRRVTPNSVTVWVALKTKATVKLEILNADGSSLSPPMTASLPTVDVGVNLHIVAVTAHRTTELFEGWIYLYKLTFDAGAGTIDLPTAANTKADAFAYAPYSLPSFALPPSDLTKLRLMHGSCRKPNAVGPDALALLDTLLAEYPDQANSRPHQLLLTGDQIYADEVAEVLLLMLTDAGDTLLGWPAPEQLPAVGSFAASVADKIPPGTRMARIQAAGFTSEDTRSHLMSLGEYLAMYLFVWSDVLWPVTVPLPTPNDVAAKMGVALREITFAGEMMPNAEHVDAFRKTLPQVRRALANIPIYMICDDHEITDDWNLTRSFCNHVYGSDLGTRVVQNGLVAYSLCQAWGNTPMQFDKTLLPEPAGAQLLDLLSSYEANSSAIQTIVGIHPPAVLAAHKPNYAVFHDPGVSLQVEGYTFGTASLYFHHTIEGPSHQIIVTDTRTWRSFPGSGDLDHADLLPLDPLGPLDMQITRAPALNGRQLMVVVTTNMPPSAGIRYASTVSQRLSHENDFLDSWDLPSLSMDHMVVKLSDAIKVPSSTGTITGNVVLLSGDVHHSFASRMIYQAQIRVDDPAYPQPVQMVFAQLISSALHNQNGKTAILHKEGYESTAGAPGKNLMPKHVTETYAGWNFKAISAGNPNAPPFLIGQEFIGDPSAPVNLPPRSLYVDSATATFRVISSADNVHRGVTGGRIDHVTLSQTPHFTYTLDYLVTSAGDSVPPVLSSPPSQSDIDANRAAMDAYRTYSGVASGRQIVGLNNISEVTFEGDARRPTVVHHTVRWQEPKGVGFRWGQYSVSLVPPKAQP